MTKDFIKIVLAVLSVTLIRKLAGLTNYHIGIDDANIYFVYVRNLYEGNGFIYNPGGVRVEGFTSFLWTLLLTIIYALRFLPFETTVLVFSFLITAATVFFYFRFVKSHFSEPLAWVMVIYLLLTPGYIDWNVFTLMDLCLWIMASSAAILLLISKKYNRWFYVITITLPFIRPEGLALCFIIGVLKIFQDYADGVFLKNAIKKNIAFLFCITLSVFALTVFRLTYFGYPVPNTFYAKVSMSLTDNIKTAFFYFYDTLRHTTWIPFALLVICLLHFGLRKYYIQWRSNSIIISLVLIILFFTGYPFLSGGDHFKYARFFQPVFPQIALLFLLLFGCRINLKRPLTVALVTLVLIFLNLNSTDETSLRDSGLQAANGYIHKLRLDIVSSSELQSEFDIAVNGRRLAGHMNTVMKDCDSLPSFGVVAAGGIGYIYNGRLVDLMGLNNPEMAHADKVKSKGVKNHGSFNKKVFYRQQVDIFLTWPDPLTPIVEQDDLSAVAFLQRLRDPHYFINRVCGNIFNDVEFRSLYSFCKISNGRSHFYGFIKPDEFSKKYPCLSIFNLDLKQTK
jgi:hypothetical protein